MKFDFFQFSDDNENVCMYVCQQRWCDDNDIDDGDKYGDSGDDVLDLGHIFLLFDHFEPLSALFEPHDPSPGEAKLGLGSNCHCICP